MRWWYKVKDQKAIVVLTWICGGVIALGTFLGAINSIVEFKELGWLDGADGFIANTCRQLLGWLAIQVSVPIWLLLPVLAFVVFITLRLSSDRSKLSQSLAEVSTELEVSKQPKPPESITLSPDQESVLFWVVLIYNTRQTGAGVAPALLSGASELPLTTIDAALNALEQKGVVKTRAAKLAPVELTPEGLTYLQREAARLRYEQFCLLVDSTARG